MLTDFRSSSDEQAEAVGVDRAGRIVVAGHARVGGGTRIALARYEPDGSLDRSFHGDGKVVTNFWSAKHESANALAIDDMDRIVVGGWAMVGEGFQFALARYNDDGTLDLGFDRDGKVLTDIRTSDRELATAVAIDGAGRVVAAGWAQGGEAMLERFALARYAQDGALDPAFGGGAFEAALEGTTASRANALVLDDEGRVLLAGWAVHDGIGHFAVARFRSDGSFDPDFGRRGYVLTEFGARSQHGQAIAIDDRGRIVVAGTAAEGERWRIALARYHDDGTLDEEFADRGRLLSDIQRRDTSLAHAMALDGRFRIVLAGWAGRPEPPQFALSRFNESGTLDESFGERGAVVTGFDRATMQEATAVVIDPGGRIVAAGFARIDEDR